MNQQPPKGNSAPRRGAAPAGFGVALAVALFVANGTSCPAGEPSGPPAAPAARPPASNLTLGVAAGYSTPVYRRADADLRVLPFARYRVGRFELAGTRLLWHVREADPLGISAFLGPSFDGYRPRDSRVLRGMGSTDFAVMGGASLSRRSGEWTAELAAEGDVSWQDAGQKASLQLSRRIPILPRALMLQPGLAVHALAPDYTRHVFGVEPDEARPGRPAYRPGWAFNPGADVAVLWMARRDTVLRLQGGYSCFDDAIRSSPIVGAAGRWSLFVSLGWAF